MRLIRWKGGARSYPGILIGSDYFDLSSLTDDFDETFFAEGGVASLKDYLEGHAQKLKTLPANFVLDSPVARPSKIVCVGLNYIDHAKEINAALPAEPVLFFKATTALSGPYDNIIIPKGSAKTDWEVELAVVIGKKASYINEKESLDYVAGYSVFNDVSEREFQMDRGGTWDKGKSCDSFGPMGPLLVTQDELTDDSNLNLWLRLNGKIMQNSNTSNLIFRVPFLLAYISQFMTLLPGDIVSTGTPAGVGLGRNPQQYLKAGDVIEYGIDGLGAARHNVINYR